MNVSGDERYGWGKQKMEKLHHVKRHKSRMFRRGARTLEYTNHTWDFQCAIRTSAVNSSCSPLPSFVFGVKVPPSQKSQILYDTVEIALSKMQSAKAASSADELPRLRERQWHVSFAPTGSSENKTSVRHNATFTWINILQVTWPKPPQRSEHRCPTNIFVGQIYLLDNYVFPTTSPCFERRLKKIKSKVSRLKEKKKVCAMWRTTCIILLSSCRHPPSHPSSDM